MKSKLVYLALFSTIFADAAGIGIVYPTLTPLLLGDASPVFDSSSGPAFRFAVYGLLLAIYPLMMCLGSPWLGELSDRKGRKPILMLCLAGNAGGMCLTACGVWLGSLPLICCGRALAGITAASLPVAQAAIIDLSTAETKAANLSLITAANGIGFVVGPLLGGIMYQQGAALWQPYLWAALLPAASAVLVLLFHADSRALSGGADGGAWRSLWATLRRPELRQSLVLLALFLVGYYMYFNYMAAFALLRYGFDAWDQALLLAYYSACFAISMLFIVPWLTRRFGLERILLVSLGCQPALVAAAAVGATPAALWLLTGPLAVAVSTTYVCLLSIASNRTLLERQGQLMGLTSSINALAWGVAPLITAALQPLGTLLPIVVAALVLLAGVACMLFDRQRQALPEAAK
ncbi:MFS transporter [Rugamonas sp. CCM 8940]|uniref:MFS transporter n=1 Tax=Rugamonas sp. CCM 8940 TaxID=2765359 RepID=UPI0018F5B080|nr:MFS transporter [Rugamonas sp. CCM 8940]MBJ7311129.1 MFS transporter [Rugamonas sp. CCM 8940]